MPILYGCYTRGALTRTTDYSFFALLLSESLNSIGQEVIGSTAVSPENIDAFPPLEHGRRLNSIGVIKIY